MNTLQVLAARAGLASPATMAHKFDLSALPAEMDIYGRDDWTSEQRNAVFAQVAADRKDYFELLDALTAVDQSLAGVADDCARENMPAMTEDQFGFWRAMYVRLASAAGQIWENERRDLNAEIGRVIY